MVRMRRVLSLLIATVAAVVLIHTLTCAMTGAGIPSPSGHHASAVVDHLPDAVEATVSLALLITAVVCIAGLRRLVVGDVRIGRPHPLPQTRPPPRPPATTARRLAQLSLLVC